VSPIIYGIHNLPGAFTKLAAFNPLSGIFTLYRVGFFPDQWDSFAVFVSAVMSVAILALGVLVFPRLERPVLKEL
jgi:ABC-2 type transport system permease protein